jgi:cytoskeletal protein CcmA (bactofilin family)
MQKGYKRKWGIILGLAALFGLLLSGVAVAAEFGGNEVYRLPNDTVVDDDLYVSAGEVYIDGVVNGDLYATGGYIEINGEVTGDVVIAGGGIIIRGVVGDDVRVAGAGIDILGAVNDDVFIAGGGAGPGGFAFPFQMSGRTIEQGVRVGNAADIGGDLHVVGGQGALNGRVGGDLSARMGTVTLGARVAGNAEVHTEDLRLGDNAAIAGQFLYSTPDRVANADAIAGSAVYQEPAPEERSPNPIVSIFGWLLRTILILIGFALLGWLLLRFAPAALTRPAAAMDAQPVETGLYGLVAVLLFIFIPILSAVTVILIWIFWGWFSALIMFIFLFGILSLLWLFSPLVTGLWLGQRIMARSDGSSSLQIALLMGVLIIVVLGRVPLLGWVIYLISFIFALGSLIQMARRRRVEPPSAVAVTG